MSNEGQRYTIRQIGEDLGHIAKKIISVLEDHELRLQAVENPDLKADLLRVRRAVEEIGDPQKKTTALILFREICDMLGVEDLETP